MKNIKKLVATILAITFSICHFAPYAMCANSLPVLPQQYKSEQSSGIKFNSDISISKRNTPITLSLRNSDVKQVLRMFADKAGKNIIFHSSTEKSENNSSSGGGDKDNAVVSTVSMDLVKVPLNDAFKMVLQVANLTYIMQKDTIIIMSLEAAKKSTIGRQNMSVIPVTYLDASKVANFLNTNIFASGQPGLSNANIAVTNPDKNEILLFGNQNDYQIAKKIVEHFDIKPNEETFVVNHTTPKEMSSLICKVLFKDLAKTPDDDNVVLMDDEEEEEEDEEDDEEDEVSAVKVGEGKIACQFRAPAGDAESKGGAGDKEGALVSLDTGGLTIVYYADRGMIYAKGGTLEQMKQIREFIEKNDRQQLQAYLEMSIIELNETGSKEFTNAWVIQSHFFTGGFGSSFVNLIPIDIIGNGDYHYSGDPLVSYTMNYLVQNGKGRVLANPRILVTSGQKSNIAITSSYIEKVTTQVMDTVSSMNGAVQKTYNIGNDLGIEVELQPYISPDGYVTINIVPSYSTVKEQITEPRALVTNETLGTTQIVNDLVATLIDKREMNLKNIRIKDGETMVIGGMLKETETKRVNKVPVLGDLPLVGMFFRSTTSAKEKNELVIMLTPRIIQDSNKNVKENKATL